MQSWFSPQRAIRMGWIACWVFIIGYPASFAAGLLIAASQIDPVWYLDTILNVVWYVLFILFLFGVRGFAEKKTDLALLKTMNTLIVVSLMQILLLHAYSFQRFFTPEFLQLVLVALVPLICVYGILLIRLADAFSKYSGEHILFKRIAWWNRIAGWMMASVVLAVPGLFVALVGEFFLWRLLARET